MVVFPQNKLKALDWFMVRNEVGIKLKDLRVDRGFTLLCRMHWQIEWKNCPVLEIGACLRGKDFQNTSKLFMLQYTW